MSDTLAPPIDLTRIRLSKTEVDAEFMRIADQYDEDDAEPQLRIDEIIATKATCDQSVYNLASNFVSSYSDKPIEQLSLLHGASYFTKQYRDKIQEIAGPDFSLPKHHGFEISRYSTDGRKDLRVESVVNKLRFLPGFKPAGKYIEVIDDLIDEGKTLEAVCKALGSLGAAGIIVTVAVQKDAVPDQIDLSKLELVEEVRVGMIAPNKWLVGFGMNADRLPHPELYRNLPLIASLGEQ